MAGYQVAQKSGNERRASGSEDLNMNVMMNRLGIDNLGDQLRGIVHVASEAHGHIGLDFFQHHPDFLFKGQSRSIQYEVDNWKNEQCDDRTGNEISEEVNHTVN